MGDVGLLPPPPPDDDDRFRSVAGGRYGADPSRPNDADLLRLRVPDDLRGLEDEVRAIQAELGIDPDAVAAPTTRRGRFAARITGRGRRRRRTAPPGLARSLLVGPVVAATLLLLAGLVALLPATGPEAGRTPAPVQLATPSQPPGSVGGLLPDVGLDAPMHVVPARSLRPAVLMLVPDGCACPGVVHDLVGQVEEFPGISSALVGSADPGIAELAVARNGGDGRLPALVDRSGTLARTYHGGPAGSAPTVLIVAADGTLTEPPLVFTTETRIEAALLPLTRLKT
jgi:hypothetical protein